MAVLRRDPAGPSRRRLMGGAASLAALAALQPPFATAVLAQPALSADPFALGVAAGDPWPDGFVIWTRLAPAPLEGGGMPPQPVEVIWEVADDPRFTRIAARGLALARPELAHALHVEVTGLRPGRPYHYRFRLGAWESRAGQARTAPAADAAAAIRLISAGCQHYEQGLFTAWRHIAEEPDIDLVFHYGDFIYEYAARPVGAVAGGRSAIRSHLGGETRSLAAYRARYAQYRLDPDLAAASAAHAFAVTFDDHEVENNWTGLVGGRGEGGDSFALRKAAAFQAWYEHMPVRRAALPRGAAIVAHRRLALGRHVGLHLLDTRGQRDDQPCGDGTRPPCAEVARDDASVLGPAQEAWLLAGAAQSGATWQVLAQQVPMFRREFANGALAMDKWDGYPAARARLLHGLRDRGVANTVVLSGDVHSAWAATVSAAPEGPPLATEFTASSISSEGDGSEQRSGTEAMLARNPNIAFHNNRRGYALHEFGAARCTTSFRALAFVSRPGAPREDRGRFVVERGEVRIQRA